jgi:phage terminase large subunit
VYGLGLQAVVEGLIFKDVVLVDDIPVNVRKRWRGMDFGYTNDPTAIVTVGVDGNNLYIDEVAYNTQMLSGDIIRTLKAQEEQLEVIAESADPRLIQEIYRAGINIHPVKKFGGSVEAGIQKMLQYTLHITKRSTNVIKEQKNYTYRQDKEGKWLNEPIDAYNHAMDAVRYVVMAKLLGGERKPLDKAAIRRVVY